MVACCAFYVHCIVIISLYLFKCRGLSQLIAFWPPLTVRDNDLVTVDNKTKKQTRRDVQRVLPTF